MVVKSDKGKKINELLGDDSEDSFTSHTPDEETQTFPAAD